MLFSFAKVANDFHLPLALAGVYSLLREDQRERERSRAHAGILECKATR